MPGTADISREADAVSDGYAPDGRCGVPGTGRAEAVPSRGHIGVHRAGKAVSIGIHSILTGACAGGLPRASLWGRSILLTGETQSCLNNWDLPGIIVHQIGHR
eukprot:196878-Hanusia_phi.AAC.3